MRVAHADTPCRTLETALAALPGCDFVVDGGARGPDAEALRACASERGLMLLRLGESIANLGELSSAIDRLQAIRQRATA